ncbi:IS5 family transposase [Planotetraspora sp. GP83]|uniref:IS5 family transposase n=1 Tax=Planotetraspora sp. GP83 TaxID=3156264 RepID=UPI003515702C
MVPRERRYPSDLTDAQWALIEPLLPAPSTGGRPEKHPRRDIVDAILYVVRAGCAWRQLPFDFPPWQTVYWYFVRWEEAKVTEQMLAVLRRRVRAAQGRAEEPTAGIIDSQSVKGADTVGRESRGYDAGKKVNGRKRFIVTDTLGLLLVVCVMAASVQDRDGAKTTLLAMYLVTPVRYVFADAGFAGVLVEWTQRVLHTVLHIVRKAPGQIGFAVIERRWVVERSLAWLTSHRRLARDYERHTATAEAMIRWAAISGMARRLTRGSAATRQQRYVIDEPTN